MKLLRTYYDRIKIWWVYRLSIKTRIGSAIWAFTAGFDVKEFFRNSHSDPSNCPSWYDWCHCYPTYVDQYELLEKIVKEQDQELQKLRNPNTIMKTLI